MPSSSEDSLRDSSRFRRLLLSLLLFFLFFTSSRWLSSSLSSSSSSSMSSESYSSCFFLLSRPLLLFFYLAPSYLSKFISLEFDLLRSFSPHPFLLLFHISSILILSLENETYFLSCSSSFLFREDTLLFIYIIV